MFFSLSPKTFNTDTNLTPAIVELDDPKSNDKVKLSVSGMKARLRGTVEVAAINGSASFCDIRIDYPGSYQLIAECNSKFCSSNTFYVDKKVKGNRPLVFDHTVMTDTKIYGLECEVKRE